MDNHNQVNKLVFVFVIINEFIMKITDFITLVLLKFRRDTIKLKELKKLQDPNFIQTAQILKENLIHNK